MENIVVNIGSREARPYVLPNTDHRLTLSAAQLPITSSLRWPDRPSLPEGNDAWSFMVKTDNHAFCLMVGEYLNNGKRRPFDVCVNGAEQPRGLSAVAETLSTDMRTVDRKWIEKKLDILIKTRSEDAVNLTLPGGNRIKSPSLVSAFAQIVKHRCETLKAFEPEQGESFPVLDTVFYQHQEPKSGTNGTIGWMVDIKNVNSADDFVLATKELVMPDGQQRPYSFWMAGDYPRPLDGLCKMLSLDARVMDVSWIGMKLRNLLTISEPLGELIATVPNTNQQQVFPSTVAYVATLLIHRYAMLGLLDTHGYPITLPGETEQEAA